MLLFKLIVVILLIFIVVSLFTALYQLNKTPNNAQGEDSNKVVRALTVRIGLSIFLFLLLMAGAYFGLITPHGVHP